MAEEVLSKFENSFLPQKQFRIPSGAVAQMVERLLSMQEAGGSMPPSSTFSFCGFIFA